MLKDIHIEGFRGISDLEIQDFKQINILLGKNNCGKTSVLEGIYILKNGVRPYALHEINAHRNFLEKDDNALKSLFEGFTFKKKGIIETTLNGDFLRFHFSKSNNQNQADFSFEFFVKEVGMSIFFKNEDNRLKIVNHLGGEIGGEFDFSHSELAIFLGTRTPLKFIHTKYDTNDYFSEFANLFINKKHTSFINTLQKVDASIQSISIVGDSIYFDTGLASLIPIQIAGDGIKRILSVLVAMASSENGIVLIDEIENGLHYSSMKTLWRAIIEAAKQYKVQLFITTHNAETLKYLAEVLEETEYKDFQQEVNSYTLRRLPDGSTKAYLYDFDKFENAIEMGIEMR